MKTEETPQIKEIVASLKPLRRLSLREIRKSLRDKGYRWITSGGYKSVYKKKGEPVCVKVYQTETGWEEDSYHVPSDIRKYYLYPVLRCKKFLVQEWIERRNIYSKTYQKIQKIPATLTEDDWRDLVGDNIGIKDGKEVIIDFLT